MPSRLAAPLGGIAAGAMTLGVAEIGAVILTRFVGTGGTPSPLLAVGGAFVDRTPPWLKDFAIATFGTNDKLALFVGMGLTLLVACAVLGEIASRYRTLGLVLFAIVGAVGSGAVLTRPGAVPLDMVPTIVGTLVGMLVLAALARAAANARVAAYDPQAPTRRGVVAAGATLSLVGAVALVWGRMQDKAQEAVRTAREAIGGPTAADPVAVPGDAELDIDGLAPYISPNDDFYRIDTALSVPQVDPSTWTLRVHGMVDNEVEISFDELLEEEMVQSLTTLTCVSNTVGGELIGNAVWTGWPIRELLARAGVQDGADMVLSTSEDGWTAGTPLEALTDDRNALFAVWMNGEPLPAQHGFPVRMVVPGLYGYVSATKWVVDLKVTTFADDEGYWTPRGWTALGPIKTSSRIDVPRSGASVSAGTTPIAGVAWAQHTGIELVEVKIDDGEWQEADLAAEPTIDSWLQWTLPWDATSGDHTITVRATNADGETQTSDTAPPAPSGATGWHSVDVSVS